MKGQPKKASVDYDKRLSKEIKNIFEEIKSEVMVEYPALEVSVELFFMYTLHKADCMLYKTLNLFNNTSTIDSLCEVFGLMVTEQTGLVSSVVGTKTLSNEMKLLLAKANKESLTMECQTITSDHVLLALLNEYDNSNLIKLNFIKSGITYDIFKNYSAKLHDLTNELEGRTKKQSPTDKFISAIIEPDKDEEQKYHHITFCKNIVKTNVKEEPFVGRDKEINQIEYGLAKKFNSNIMLVGDNGVGKTAIINNLAHRIGNPQLTPPLLRGYNIYQLDFLEMSKDTEWRGIFEGHVSELIHDLKNAVKPILFIDNFDSIVEQTVGDRQSSYGAIYTLFTTLDIPIIVNITSKALSLLRRYKPIIVKKFQIIDVDELSEKEAKVALAYHKKELEKFHKIQYDDDIIDLCVKLSKRYIVDKPLPFSAIEVLDQCSAEQKSKKMNNPELREIENELLTLEGIKNESVKKDDIDNVKNIDKLINEAKLRGVKIKEEMEHSNPIITKTELYETISKMVGVPLSNLSKSEKEILSNIDKVLKKHIIGQDEAIESVTRAIKRNKIGLYLNTKPIGSFLCVGNTGCGKTLLAKELAKEIFGDENCLIRFDMSEYADKTSLNKLIGASAGYVGYQEGGLLTEAIKKKRHAVLLLDEIEKADTEIYNLFLQIMDEGFLTDNTGQKVDFKNTIIIMTSNVGAKDAMYDKPIGFNCDYNKKNKAVLDKSLKNKFPPEFINRLDEVIYFNKLSDENYKKIIEIELDKMSKRLNNIKFNCLYDNITIDFIFNKITDKKEYGARPIIKTIQQEIENKITDLIIDEDYPENYTFDINKILDIS